MAIGVASLALAFIDLNHYVNFVLICLIDIFINATSFYYLMLSGCFTYDQSRKEITGTIKSPVPRINKKHI
jgi:hypothetical protein